MATLKDRRFISEAMEILDTMDNVVDFDPTERFIEIIDMLGGDDEKFSKSLADALVQKGFEPERIGSIIDSIKSATESSSMSPEVYDTEEDIFYDPLKRDQQEQRKAQNQDIRDRQANQRGPGVFADHDSASSIRTLSQSRGKRDEDQSLYPDFQNLRTKNGRRVNYNEL